MTHILTAIIFNFYSLTWVPFPEFEPESYNRMDRCVVRMNELNRELERTYSAIRMVCQTASF